MHLRMPSQPTRNRDPFHVLSMLFTVLACLSLFIGSLIVSIILLGDGNVSFFSLLTIQSGKGYLLDAQFWITLILLIPTLGLFGLFSMAALLCAKRWVAAGLALPVTLGIFLIFSLAGFFLDQVFAISTAPLFTVLLLTLNGSALWRAWRFLTQLGGERFENS